jgi:hypothetical protein
MKEDTCPNHNNSRLPILDTEMWIENGMIQHGHYSKPMSSTEVVLARSAMSATTKRNILVQEGTRRLKNCHLSLPWATKANHVNGLMISMHEAGHSRQFRIVVATRILANYKTIVDNNSNGTKPIYRSKQERRDQKLKEGISNKATWFRKGGFTATLTVPTTKDSTLVNSTRRALDVAPGPSHTKVKVLERPGVPIMRGISVSNPFPRLNCGRDRCPLKWMKDGCKDKCYVENITYQAHCTRCRDDQLNRGIPLSNVRDQVYEGESSRSLYTRTGQHVYNYVKEATRHRHTPVLSTPPTRAHSDGQVEEEVGSSFMWDHTLAMHEGQVSHNPHDDYRFRVVGHFTDALTRLLEEATRIAFARNLRSIPRDQGQGVGGGVGGILNRRDEHFAPRKRYY